MRKLDQKYGINDDHIFNLVSGEKIPDDEPLFLFRARDKFALVVLNHYLKTCTTECNDLHIEGIKQTIRKFEEFCEKHPERMKQPGVTKHLALEENQ